MGAPLLFAGAAWLAKARLAAGVPVVCASGDDPSVPWLAICALDASVPAALTAEAVGAPAAAAMPARVSTRSMVCRSCPEGMDLDRRDEELGEALAAATAGWAEGPVRVAAIPGSSVPPALAVAVHVRVCVAVDGGKSMRVDAEAEAALRQAGGGPEGATALLGPVLCGCIAVPGCAVRLPAELVGPGRWAFVFAMTPSAAPVTAVGPSTTIVLPRPAVVRAAALAALTAPAGSASAPTAAPPAGAPGASPGSPFSFRAVVSSPSSAASPAAAARPRTTWHPCALECAKYDCDAPVAALPGTASAAAAAALRRSVVLPLRRPDLVGWGSVPGAAAVAAASGAPGSAPPRAPDVDPPRAVLLHGLPGAGKRAVVHAVAREASALPRTRVRVVAVSGADVAAAEEDDALSRLRRVFRGARRWLSQPRGGWARRGWGEGLVGAAAEAVERSEAARWPGVATEYSRGRRIVVRRGGAAHARGGAAADDEDEEAGAAAGEEEGGDEDEDAEDEARVCIVLLEGMDRLLPPAPGSVAPGGDDAGAGDADDAAGQGLSPVEVAFRSQLLCLMEAHCWNHDAEGAARPAFVRVPGDDGAEACGAADESSEDEDDGGAAGGAALPGSGAPWRRDALPRRGGAAGTAPRRLVVVGTAASLEGVDAAARTAGLLEADAPVDAPAVTDRAAVLREALRRSRSDLRAPATAEGKAFRLFAEGLIGYLPSDVHALVGAARELARQDAAIGTGTGAGPEEEEENDDDEGDGSAPADPAALDAAFADLRARAEDAAVMAASARAGSRPPAPAPAETITLSHLERARREVPGSALRGLQTAPNPASWDDVGGVDAVKEELVRRLQWPIEHREVFESAGVAPPPGVLLFGPPGCSKTLLVRALATSTRASFFALSGADVYSKYVGEAERNLREAFRRARAATPAVIFLDEVDALVGSRGASSAETDGGASAGVLATLLTEIDGIDSAPGVVVVAATNRPESLDAALLRPGRLELRLLVAPPDAAGRLDILRVHAAPLRLGPDVDLPALAGSCDRFTGAEIEALCRLAATRAHRAARGEAIVTAAHFADARQSVSTLFGGPAGAAKLARELARLREFASGTGLARAGEASLFGTAAAGRAAAAPLPTPASVFGAPPPTTATAAAAFAAALGQPSPEQ